MKTKNNHMLYDYLIIDEASQTDMLACIGAMSCAKNLIVVGDLKQLPQVDSKIFKDYFDNNKLSVEKDKIPNQLLKEHYRCHPVIMTQDNEKTNPFELLIGESFNYTKENNTSEKELNNIKSYLKENNIKDIGIISPFRAQANLIDGAIGNEQIIANTIHKFQGQEKETIIFAVTKANIKGRNDFVSNPQLINVAVSRAKNKFILAYAGNLEERPDNDVKDLLKYIQYNYPKA
ncbi:hypothetical protein FQA39_LY12814 [Lamprigera yunnana]|nr:hypothetical protein FQA39_LY12814 [Lamprigera yunnana]